MTNDNTIPARDPNGEAADLSSVENKNEKDAHPLEPLKKILLSGYRSVRAAAGDIGVTGVMLSGILTGKKKVKRSWFDRPSAVEGKSRLDIVRACQGYMENAELAEAFESFLAGLNNPVNAKAEWRKNVGEVCTRILKFQGDTFEEAIQYLSLIHI